MDESALEENELVHQEGAVDKQGAIKEDNTVESLGEVVVLVDRGVTDKLSADKDVVAMEDQDKVVEQAVIDSGTKTNVIAFDDQEVVFKQGVIDGRGATGSAIAAEEQDNVVDLTAGDNKSMETKDENIVDASEKVVEQGARCKQDTVRKNHFTMRDHEEAVELYVSDELRAENDQSAVEECNAVEQGVISEIGGAKDTAKEKQGEVKEQNTIDKWGTTSDGVAPETLKEVVQPLRHEWGATEDDLSADMADSGGVSAISSSEVVPAMKSGGDEETGTKEKVRLCVGYPQRPGRLNCPFYMSTGRCTYGFSCHFNHPRLKAKSEVQSFTSEQGSREVMELLELNRVGLPIREGARNCTYYMRNGTCRYGKKCCFNHPEQVLDVQVYAPTGWEDNNMPSSPHSSNLPSSPLSKKSSGHATLDDTLSSSEVLPANILRMLLPPQKAPPGTEIKVQKDPNWSSASDDSDDCCSADSSSGPLCKQEHVDYPNMSGRQECPFLVRFGNCKFASTCKYYHPKDNFSSRYESKKQSSRYESKKKQSPAEELIVYPDRPDEPECPFYMKTGHCKFGAACKFHHPKDLTSSMRSPSIPKRSVTANEHHPAPRTTLQDHMNKQQQYPERPGQPDCRYYMQFGKCKFLSACIFNHPKDRLPGMPECPFYMKTGKCQFGSTCEFHHPEDRCSSTAVTIEDGSDFEYDNFTKSENGLQEDEQTMYPERSGAPECFHYMKHGYCKFQTNCKYHHPRGRLPKN
ncbi:hypothetical protein ACP70R_039472 [Stipagrostis hirtigluma subsp. patula]